MAFKSKDADETKAVNEQTAIALGLTEAKQLMTVSELMEHPDFPKACLMLPGESAFRYKMFIYYLVLGPSVRTVADVTRAFYPDQVIVTSASLVPGTSELSTKNSTLYMRTYEAYQEMQWKKRAQIWDAFVAKIQLAQIAVVMQTAPLKAWKALVDIVDKTKAKDADRIRAAEAVLDRSGYPRVSEKIVDTTVRQIRDMSDVELKKLLISGMQANIADTVEGECTPVIREKEIVESLVDDA